MSIPLEIRSMPTLLEQRNNLMTEMETLISTAKTETRSMTDEENTRFETIKTDINRIDKTLAAEAQAEQMRMAEEGDKTKTPEQEERMAEAEDKFIRFIKGETRALDVANNGGIIPTEISSRILTRVRELSPIYQRATIFNVAGDLVFPKFDQYSIQTNYVADMTALTAQNGNFTTLKLQNFIAGSLVTISRSLMNRQDFDLVSFIVNAMAQSIANFLEKECLTGVGTTALTGIFTDSNVTSVTAAGTTTVALDDLITTQLAIPEALQANACWIMNKALFTSLRKMKDTQGYPLLNNDITSAFGWQLLGKPVYVSVNAPSTYTTGQKVLAYGDMSGLYVKHSQNLETQILNELYATSHATGVVGYIEADSRVVEDQKIAILKLA
jgi:HK97 family phage major capsid protein